MTRGTSEEASTENNRVYQLRRKNFQKKLVTTLASLGYILIVLEYLKYGCSIWTLAIRVVVQAMLAAPFPNEMHIRRLSSRNELETSTYLPRLSLRMPGDARNVIQEPMPGGFPSPSGSDVTSDDQVKKDLEDVKKKIRKVIFHGALTMNILYLLICIVFPVNFVGKFGGKHLDEDGLGEVPSPFNNANGLVQGEHKGGFFMQMVGELVPTSNLKGNVGLVMFQFGILICQFGLFILTCVNLADLGFEENLPEDLISQSKSSDGYDGRVFVTQLDPIEAINQVLSYSNQEQTDNSSMV